MEADYIELIKQRILKGDLSKPEELYPLLMAKMEQDKSKDVIPWLQQFSGDTLLDVGGGNGYLIKDMNFKNKFVMDKRVFDQFDNICYIQELYKGQDYNQDLTIMSEFLHLFDYDTIETYVSMVKGKLIIIENKFDDFLDLRLRMWSNGRCLDEDIMTSIVGHPPIDLGEFIAWEI